MFDVLGLKLSSTILILSTFLSSILFQTSQQTEVIVTRTKAIALPKYEISPPTAHHFEMTVVKSIRNKCIALVQFFMSEGLHESRKGPASEQLESETSVLESVLQILKLLLPLCVLPLSVIWKKVRGSSQSGTCKTDAGKWVATHLAASAQVENDAWADVQWVEERLEPFRRVSKVERRDSRFLSVVRLKNWQKFSESLLDAVFDDGAEEPRSLLKAKLAAVPKLGVLDDFEHVVFLNYESGGSRYRSCVKILCKRLNEDEVAVAYGMYGQKWVDRKHYLMDQTFWEQSPNQQKMENFLSAGVSGVVKELLSGDVSAMEEL